MIRTFHFDDIAAVDASLKNLRRYNQAMYISVDEKLIDNELAELYFRTTEGSKEEAALEKLIGASAIQACNDNPDIPQRYKQKVGNRMQREFLASFRASKVDYLYHSGQLGMPTMPEAEKEREGRHKEISIVGKTHYLDKATKIIRNRSIRLVEKEGISKIIEVIITDEPTIKWTTQAATWATSLIPERVKNKVKATAKEYFEKTANIIEKNIDRFAKTPYGSKVVNVINTKVAPIIERGIENVAQVCSTVKQEIKSAWTKLKSRFA